MVDETKKKKNDERMMIILFKNIRRNLKTTQNYYEIVVLL